MKRGSGFPDVVVTVVDYLAEEFLVAVISHYVMKDESGRVGRRRKGLTRQCSW